MIGIDEQANEILNHYGQPMQEIQAVQELSELILLLVARDDQRKVGYKEHVTEEIADSFIMIEQIRIANGITDGEVRAVLEEKIERQFNRMEEEAKHD